MSSIIFLKSMEKYKVTYKPFDSLEGSEFAYHRWHATAVLGDEPVEGVVPKERDVSYSGMTFLRVHKDHIVEIVLYSDLCDVLQKHNKE